MVEAQHRTMKADGNQAAAAAATLTPFLGQVVVRRFQKFRFFCSYVRLVGCSVVDATHLSLDTGDCRCLQLPGDEVVDLNAAPRGVLRVGTGLRQVSERD